MNTQNNTLHPKVSVLMSVYNGEDHVLEAVDSVLRQTFTDFEFIIVDDGSTDKSAEIIKSFTDKRIRLVHNENNIGLTRSLNKGLELATGEYIARMDADDISLPHRLKTQTNFMDTHPETGICGSWIKTLGLSSDDVWKYPTDHSTLKCSLLFAPPLAHPSIMMRRVVLVSNNLQYSTQYSYAQDYEFWVRSSRYTCLSNIGEVLLLLRQHPKKIGNTRNEDQLSAASTVRESQIRELGITPSSDELSLHNMISTWNIEQSSSFLQKTDVWLTRLRELNQTSKIYPEPEFSIYLAGRWLDICYQTSPLGPLTIKHYLASPLRHYAQIETRKKITFISRCLLKRGGWRSRIPFLNPS